MKKTRIDALLVARGLAADLKQAAALVLAGKVRVPSGRARKPSDPLDPGAEVSVDAQPFVSRGGFKLAGALDHFGLKVTGLVVLDAGASTGGFTDCLLQRGAARVHAVDVGTNLLAWKIRTDPRVVNHERTHAGHLTPEQLGEAVDLLTADLSFISLARLLPGLAALVRPGGRLLLLVKPQFEARREEVPEGGVVRDPQVRRRVVEEVLEAGREAGLSPLGVVDSALPGPEGNLETFVLMEKP
jgi:23S rRNA (cytidine1920-2'-O)/16S rRNA (cytidine1409-2'-O)-methyltransferase